MSTKDQANQEAQDEQNKSDGYSLGEKIIGFTIAVVSIGGIGALIKVKHDKDKQKS